MSHQPRIVSDYFEEALHPSCLRILIRRAMRYLKKAKVEFDTIVFRGVSGMLFGPTLAVYMNKAMIVVRKDEARHSKHSVEGNRATEKYIIVDDFIATGETVKNIALKIMDWQYRAGYKPATCQAIVFYKTCQEWAGSDKQKVNKIFGHDVKIIYCLKKDDSMIKKFVS
jgi:orotate phosphoribosyltransferase